MPLKLFLFCLLPYVPLLAYLLCVVCLLLASCRFLFRELLLLLPLLTQCYNKITTIQSVVENLRVQSNKYDHMP